RQRAALRGAPAAVAGSTLCVEGWVESMADLAKADLVVRAAGEKAENLLTVGVKRMALVEVEFAEVSYGALRNVGIKPPLNFVSGSGTGATYQIVRPLPGDSGGQSVHTISGTISA